MTVPGEGVGITDRVANVTISKWFKSMSDQAKQKHAFLHMLDKKKGIHMGCSGGDMVWPVEYKYADIKPHVDGALKTADRKTLTFDARLPWRGYESDEVWTLMEKLQNGGESAMVKLFKTREKKIKKGLHQQLGREWFKDGAATGNEHTFHGAESLFSGIGVQTAADKFATSLSSTYAGKSCSYTSLKSNATKGTDEEYGAWSGVLVNTNRNPGAGTRAWEDYADEYIRAGVLEAARGQDQEDRTDIILLAKEYYEELLNILDDKERISYRRGENVAMVKAGFTDFVEVDGVQIGWDFGMESHKTDANGDECQGYGFNMDQVGLYMLNESALWDSKTQWVMDYAAMRCYFWCLGNLRFEGPRHVLKFAAIS